MSLRIREHREVSGLSQKGLGALLGVSEDTVSAWENGRNSPRGRNMILVERWLSGKQVTERRVSDGPFDRFDSDTPSSGGYSSLTSTSPGPGDLISVVVPVPGMEPEDWPTIGVRRREELGTWVEAVQRAAEVVRQLRSSRNDSPGE